jgi:hypothetical protein
LLNPSVANKCFHTRHPLAYPLIIIPVTAADHFLCTSNSSQHHFSVFHLHLCLGRQMLCFHHFCSWLASHFIIPRAAGRLSSAANNTFLGQHHRKVWWLAWYGNPLPLPSPAANQSHMQLIFPSPPAANQCNNRRPPQWRPKAACPGDWLLPGQSDSSIRAWPEKPSNAVGRRPMIINGAKGRWRLPSTSLPCPVLTSHPRPWPINFFRPRAFYCFPEPIKSGQKKPSQKMIWAQLLQSQHAGKQKMCESCGSHSLGFLQFFYESKNCKPALFS